MAPSQRFDSARWPVFGLVVAADTGGADDGDSAYMPWSRFLPLLTVGFQRCGAFGTVNSSNEPRDRKSTRLNSSHDQISYAVFCLKKKKLCRHADLSPDTRDRDTRQPARV